MPAIKVGIPVSLTGQFRIQGQQALAGLRAWADDVNRNGGIRVGAHRRRADVVYHDDASSAVEASAITHRLIRQDRVDLLFGPYGSGLAIAAAGVAAEHGQILWNQGGAAESIHQPGRMVVSILSGASGYLTALPGLLKGADPSANSFGLARCSAGAFPRQVSSGLEAQALAYGFDKIVDLEFPPEQTDFNCLASQLLSASPDLLLVVGRIRHDIAIAKLLANQGKEDGRPRLLAAVAVGIDRFHEELGDRAEGFVGPSQWEPAGPGLKVDGHCYYYGPEPSQVEESLAEMAESSGVPVDYPMAQAYAAGLVAQRCVECAGSLDPVQLWSAAGSLDFHTFFGRFKIDPITGQQVGRSVLLVQWQQGRKVTLWPPERAQGQLQVGF